MALAPVADVIGHAGGARGDVGRPCTSCRCRPGCRRPGGVQAVVPFEMCSTAEGERGR